MLLQSADPTESPTTTAENRWTLHREASDEWCSLACSAAGWTLSMHGGEFTVVAEGGRRGGSDARDLEELRLRLRAMGWSERPAVRVRLKSDRRRSAQRRD